MPLATPAPAHRQPRLLAVVLLGGVLGTFSRAGIAHLLPMPDAFPVATVLVNLVGTFCLGLLLHALLRPGLSAWQAQPLRLLWGTGFLGSFTTMSGLALDALRLLQAGRAELAVGYLVTSLFGGVLLAWCGAVFGARLAARRGVA